MCNCGNKRNELTAALPATQQQPQAIPVYKKDTGSVSGVDFIYTGKLALTVTGNATGKLYRFNAPGDTQTIDYKDAPDMIRVPVLKRIG